LTELENKIIEISRFVTPAQGVRLKMKLKDLKSLLRYQSNPPAFDKPCRFNGNHQ